VDVISLVNSAFRLSKFGLSVWVGRGRMGKNMAAFGEVADEVFLRDLVIRGVSHREISDFYRSQYPQVRGLTERSVRRYCDERSIHRISNDELHVIVAEHIRLYGHSYGRRMMQGSVRAQLRDNIRCHKSKENLRSISSCCTSCFSSQNFWYTVTD